MGSAVVAHLWRLVAVMKHDTKHSVSHTEGDLSRGQTHLLKLGITVLSTHRKSERLHTAFTTRTRAEWEDVVEHVRGAGVRQAGVVVHARSDYDGGVRHQDRVAELILRRDVGGDELRGLRPRADVALLEHVRGAGVRQGGAVGVGVVVLVRPDDDGGARHRDRVAEKIVRRAVVGDDLRGLSPLAAVGAHAAEERRGEDEGTERVGDHFQNLGKQIKVSQKPSRGHRAWCVSVAGARGMCVEHGGVSAEISGKTGGYPIHPSWTQRHEYTIILNYLTNTETELLK